MSRHLLPLLALATLGAAATGDPVSAALDAESTRFAAATGAAPDRPYYLSWRVDEAHTWHLSAAYGAPLEPSEHLSRTVHAGARVGARTLDSTHRLRGPGGFSFPSFDAASMPLDGPADALRAALWLAALDPVTAARTRWRLVQADQSVRVGDRDASPDFSDDPAAKAELAPMPIELDPSAWRATLVKLSTALDQPGIERSSASLDAEEETRWFADTEGARIRQPRRWLRVSLVASSTTDDGREVELYRWKDVDDPAHLPEAATLEAWAHALAEDVRALRAAPEGDPATVPAILHGPAAGVFVHEVIGHRVEGHRQKAEDQDQTFRAKVGQAILPPSIDIVDDPTLDRWGNEDLNGHYAFDDEGQPAQRAVVVKGGVFEGFLMGRSPIAGFAHSNGHGRAGIYTEAVSRMANTILTTSAPVPAARLREMLIDEVKRQGKPYGLVVDDLAGGFTLTERVLPNAFKIEAERVWRVYPDGRPDELVRGVDLVGTPLDALGAVMAAGDDPGVFNGFCGAESGMVPNAAVSPSLLLRDIEIQRKEKSEARPPLLPKPEAQ
jgi:predicted Zn-dependent protease